MKSNNKRTDGQPQCQSREQSKFLRLFETFGTIWNLNGSAEAIADVCPFCGKERHCYLNVETGCYDCKVCGAQGNAYTFIQHEYAAALRTTTDRQLQRLKHIRKLPLQTLKRHGIAWHSGLSQWLIPFKSTQGELLNLLRYSPPRVRLNLPALPACLYGVDQLSDDPNRLLFLCEGAWDAIALDRHLREKKTRNRYDILAVPGANVFKPAWAEFFRRRSVRLVYDNDRAGRDGQERTARIIGPVAAEVYSLQWPDGFDDGYDISDLTQVPQQSPKGDEIGSFFGGVLT